jgi:hypothetical protein
MKPVPGSGGGGPNAVARSMPPVSLQRAVDIIQGRRIVRRLVVRCAGATPAPAAIDVAAKLFADAVELPDDEVAIENLGDHRAVFRHRPLP